MIDPLSPSARSLLKELLAKRDLSPGQTLLFSFIRKTAEVDELKAKGILLEVEPNLAMLADSETMRFS